MQSKCIFDSDRRFEFRRIRDIRVRDIELRLYVNMESKSLCFDAIQIYIEAPYPICLQNAVLSHGTFYIHVY